MASRTSNTGDPAWPPQGEWTYEDYKRLPEDGWRYEIIEGELYMTAAPRPKHQEASSNLSVPMIQFVQTHNLGKVYYAPVDVILPGLATPVEPDILFIARERLSIIKEDLIEGAPDLIVEILSPSNWLNDRRTKFRIYALAGVREYWIVDTDTRTIEVFVLRGQSYTQVGRYRPGEQAASEVLAGFAVAVADVCPA